MLISFLLGQFGPWQAVLVIAVVLLLFGGRKIPELMKGLGRGVREFKEGVKGEDENKDSGEKKIKE
ncbi:MAG: twin-arginine translocase TatA/TatE family subunit [Flavobacteriales bacterium]|nr:twin-arginine translocase TatA/TatE family subunit [Flavobacteriales bacterium]